MLLLRATARPLGRGALIRVRTSSSLTRFYWAVDERRLCTSPPPLGTSKLGDVRPVRPGEEPCTRLHLPEEDDPKGVESPLDDVAWDCPFLPVCPTHLSTRSLASAQIWLATPASLLASGPQATLSGEYLRNIDLVMRYAHVVLVDETDLVQVQFDDRFAPITRAGRVWTRRQAGRGSRTNTMELFENASVLDLGISDPRNIRIEALQQ